jgi:hypothetical protein
MKLVSAKNCWDPASFQAPVAIREFLYGQVQKDALFENRSSELMTDEKCAKMGG